MFPPVPLFASAQISSADSMATTTARILELAPQIASALLTVCAASLLYYIVLVVPAWVRKLRLWRDYCASHARFSLEAGRGRYKWIEDPWSSTSVRALSPASHPSSSTARQAKARAHGPTEAPNYWLCRHDAIKHVFSRAAMYVRPPLRVRLPLRVRCPAQHSPDDQRMYVCSPHTDHRAGFDWFHYAGWEVPTMDPRYRATVREADQTVHGKLAKSRLATLLSTVRGVGAAEVARMREAVGPGGRVVSLHSQMYRLGYNVNCVGIFGPRLDHVATRVALQRFTEVRRW